MSYSQTVYWVVGAAKYHRTEECAGRSTTNYVRELHLPDRLRLPRNLTRNIHHAAAAASLRIQVRNKQDGDCLVTVLND